MNRTIEDRLREEYFDLLPEVGSVAEQLETEIRYHIRLISSGLNRHERLAIKARVKDCESAVEKLRAQQEALRLIRLGPNCIRGEYQIASTLIGLFWDVEHSAIYKPEPRLRGIAQHLGMQQRSRDVLRALRAFEEEFETLVRASSHRQIGSEHCIHYAFGANPTCLVPWQAANVRGEDVVAAEDHVGMVIQAGLLRLAE